MYPTKDERHFEFPPVSTVMEGAKRPGHFNGVCQVVSRLFYIVRPTRAYFGEKDWQEIAVIKQLVKFIGSDVQIVECPIVRDEDGLAKSSRNTLLAADERAIAPNIYKALKESVEYHGWSKHIVSPTSLQELAVSIEGTRIAIQVTLIIKLCRIQEHRNHSHAIFLYTALNKRGVTLMQRTHSWHKADFLSLLATIEKFVLEVNNLIDYFHLLICFRVQNNNFFLK